MRLSAVLIVIATLALPATAQDTPDNPLPAPGGEIADVLARPEVRTDVLELAMAQARFPAPVLGPLRNALDRLMQNADARAELALAMQAEFDSFGIASPTPQQMTRVAATMLPPWALDGATAGLPRLPSADQRAILATRLAIAESLAPARCEAYLSEVSSDARTIELSAIAAMPPDRAAATLRLLTEATLAAWRDDPAAPAPLDPEAEDAARQALGAAIMAAVDASADADRLIAALSPTAWGDPADACAARILVLRTALDMTGPDGDRAVRLIATFGLDGS